MADSDEIYELKMQLTDCLLQLGLTKEKVAEISSDGFVKNLMMLELYMGKRNRLVEILREIIEEKKEAANQPQKRK